MINLKLVLVSLLCSCVNHLFFGNMQQTYIRFEMTILQIGVFRQDKLFSWERSNKPFGRITRRIGDFFGENNTHGSDLETKLRHKQNITNEQNKIGYHEFRLQLRYPLQHLFTFAGPYC